MIIVVGGIKGGGGKTTLATNLTVIRSSHGYKTLLVDADEQHSASDWAEQREDAEVPTKFLTIQLSGIAIHAQLRRLRDSYDDIIIDVGGRNTTSQRSALSVADVFLVPFKPRSLDIWTIGSLKHLICDILTQNNKMVSYAVINQADPRGSDNMGALNAISECEELTCLDCHIGNRKSFCNAASEGLGVTELKKKDKIAVDELNSLYDSIYNRHR